MMVCAENGESNRETGEMEKGFNKHKKTLLPIFKQHSIYVSLKEKSFPKKHLPIKHTMLVVY